MEETEKEKEKLVTFETQSIPSPSTSQFNPSLRTHSFNQNHPAFPIPPNQPDFLNTIRNILKPTPPQSNFVFPNTELPPPNTNNLPPPMLPYQGSQSVFNNSNNTTNFGNNVQQMNAFNPPVHQNQRVVPPYQFPSGNPYTIKREEPNASWWPNSSQNYQRPDNFQMNYSFSNNMPYRQDYNKQGNHGGGGDRFNSPWNNFGRTNFLEGNLNYESTVHGMTMRQAMLKESNNVGSGATRPVNVSIKFLFNLYYRVFF